MNGLQSVEFLDADIDQLTGTDALDDRPLRAQVLDPEELVRGGAIVAAMKLGAAGPGVTEAEAHPSEKAIGRRIRGQVKLHVHGYQLHADRNAAR